MLILLFFALFAPNSPRYTVSPFPGCFCATHSDSCSIFPGFLFATVCGTHISLIGQHRSLPYLVISFSIRFFVLYFITHPGRTLRKSERKIDYFAFRPAFRPAFNGSGLSGTESKQSNRGIYSKLQVKFEMP